MTRKLSLTTATAAAVAALSLGVPAALGADRQPDSSQLAPDSVAYFYANERKTLADSQGPAAVAYFYANERATLLEQPVVSGAVARDSHHVVQPAVTGSVDAVKFFYANERATMALDSQAPFVSPDTQELIKAAGQPTQSNLPTRSDSAESAIVAGRLDAPVVSTGSSGSEIEWPQVGIALVIGILLGLGLLLALRLSRIRPLAH